MTQCERILRHLQDYGSITQAEAVTEYGCYRLGARVFDLKAQGGTHQERNRHRKEPVRGADVLRAVFAGTLKRSEVAYGNQKRT